MRGMPVIDPTADSSRAGSAVPAPMGSSSESPLFLDGWSEFNRRVSEVEPVRIRVPEFGRQRLHALLYADRRGRIVLPRLNPYLPISFSLDPASRPLRLTSQWIRTVEPVVREMREHGVGDNLVLSPDVTDARPWKWAGFRTGLAYTIVNRFPADPAAVEPKALKLAHRARDLGYTWSPDGTPDEVIACLKETESRKGFRHGIEASEIAFLTTCLGVEHARSYTVRTLGGEPASAMVVLHQRGAMAVGVVGGTARAALRDGAAQLMMEVVLSDVAAHGATGMELAGSELESVALSKEAWGGSLVPLVRVEPYTLRNAMRAGRDWLRRGLHRR